MSDSRFTNICPHCLHAWHADYKVEPLNSEVPTVRGASAPTRQSQIIGQDGFYSVAWASCPRKECLGATIYLVRRLGSKEWRTMVRPRQTGRKPLPPEVPPKFAEDYLEACLVLEDSPKASAALSRRCLQLFLHEHLNIKERTLDVEIDKLLELKTLPSDIADDVDAIRQIGNFAAHPAKSLSTGEIVAVEPGEAEWTLNVLEDLFDFYFVRTADRSARRAAFKAKLVDAKPRAEFKEPPKE